MVRFKQLVPWLCLVLTVATYEAINWFPREANLNFSTSFDQATPVIPVFVIPYLSFIPLVFVIIPLYLSRKPGLLLRFGLSALATQLVLDVLYFVVPATVARPTLTGNDVFTVLLRDLVWAADRPVNTFPSNHVALTVVALIVLRQAIPRRWFYTASVWGLLIIASTLFVKQHDIADVASGVVVSAVTCWLVSRITQPQIDKV